EAEVLGERGHALTLGWDTSVRARSAPGRSPASQTAIGPRGRPPAPRVGVSLSTKVPIRRDGRVDLAYQLLDIERLAQELGDQPLSDGPGDARPVRSDDISRTGGSPQCGSRRSRSSSSRPEIPGRLT